jgi:hypothetical protein
MTTPSSAGVRYKEQSEARRDIENSSSLPVIVDLLVWRSIPLSCDSEEVLR